MKKIFIFIMAAAVISAKAATFENDGFSQIQFVPPEPEPNSVPKTQTQATPAFEKSLPIIMDGQQWKGFRSGVKNSGEVVFSGKNEWDRFWQTAMAPFDARLRKTPDVDFSREMVVGVFRGEQAYPTYEIEILSISPEESLVVAYKNIDRLIGLSTPRFSVQPYHIKIIPRFTGSIRFEKAR